MEQKIITLSANEQILEKTGGIDYCVSDTVNYIKAIFDLGANWQGFDVIQAIWKVNSKLVCTLIDSENVCMVPPELLVSKGRVWVNLVGSILVNDNLESRLTTGKTLALTVKENTNICGKESEEITPTQFEQFVGMVTDEVEKVTGMTAEAETLASSMPATASYNDGVLTIGIPQGPQGEQGPAGADYVLTSADKTEIANTVYGMIESAEGSDY